MTGRYIAFDVETPNSANNRMSAIGVTVIERGEVVEQYDYLVNPETRFASFNVALTGITPEMVADKPTFSQLWQELEPLFSSGLLVAHNAPFDMSVLAKCLRDYGIRWRPSVPYACTCQMSRRLLPQLPNHKLNTLCDFLGLELDHHRAKEVMAELDRWIDEALPTQLTVDLAGLSFTDSSGIAVLLRAWRRMGQVRGAMRGIHTPSQADKVFQAAGLHRLIRFE